MARPSNRAARRQQITDALLTVLSTEGYTGASIQAIAASAGLSPGLIHYHFSSKQEILLALCDDLVRYGLTRWEQSLHAEDDGETRALRLVDAWLARGPGSDLRRVAAWCAIGAEAVFHEEVRIAYTEALQTIRDVLEDELARWLVEAGRKPEAAPALSALVLTLFEGAYQVAAGAPNLQPDGWAAPTVRSTLRTLVQAASIA